METAGNSAADAEGQQVICPRCNKSSLVEIGLTVGKRLVRMRNCSACDSRWWDSEGQALALPGVLELASSR